MTTRRSNQDHSQGNPTYEQVERAIRRRSFCVLATTSPSGRPHAAAVLYSYAEGDLFVGTLRESRKALNLAANPAGFISLPVRRMPVGPPSSVQFAVTAQILDNDHPDVVRLHAQGALKAVTSHGELEIEAGCMLRLTPAATMHTFGLGMPLHRLVRDPLNAGGVVRRP